MNPINPNFCKLFAMARDPSSSIEIRVLSKRGSNVIHPVEVDTPPLLPSPSPGPVPVVYREIKHFKKWVPWLIPSFVVANIIMFGITMYVNNCPKNSISCIADFLGRFSFQPFKENPLLGPSSSTWVLLTCLDLIWFYFFPSLNASVWSSGLF